MGTTTVVETARRLERAGGRAVWTNEGVGGKDALAAITP
jgi:hypothetical protein